MAPLDLPAPVPEPDIVPPEDAGQPTTADPQRTTPHAPPAASPEAAPAPFTIAGRFEVGAVIARGGMGAVHAAVDRLFDREVAVKLVREDLAGTAVADRFFGEARITGQLQHPAIPPVHDVGTLADGRPYLVMKLIKGRTLAALLEEREKPGGDLDRFLTVFEQVCLAVAFAHARGVIHRDLKPENVMVGAFGEVQVMDWGLAKRLTDRERGVPGAAEAGGPESFAQTRAGTVLGTLAYMPPEQARGETEQLDARSDVFGLGGILCAILTGQPPHGGRDPFALREKIASGDLGETFERLERSPGPLLVNRLAIRCLAAGPAARPAHAGEVASSLRSILGFLEKSLRQSEVQDATHDADEQQKAARRRAGTFMKIGVAGVLFGVLVGGCGLWNASRYEADARYTEKVTGGKLRAVSRELFPFVLDALAKDVSTGVFQRGMDRDGRERSMQRVRVALANLGPEDQARGYLALAAAAAAIPEESSVNAYWQLAIKHYEAVAAEGTEIEVACRAITWEFPDLLRPAVVGQARQKLQIALRAAGVSKDLRRKAEESMAAADAALKGEDGPAAGKGPRGTGKRVRPQ